MTKSDMSQFDLAPIPRAPKSPNGMLASINPQVRATYNRVGDKWLTTREVAEIRGIPSTRAGQHLLRLRKMGLVEDRWAHGSRNGGKEYRRMGGKGAQ